MSPPVLQRQHYNFVLRKIIFRQLYAALENREHMLGFEFLRLGLGSVALQAESIGGVGAQQMIVRAAVGFVASRASLLERRLMQHVLFGLLGLIGVAAQ